MPNLLNKSRTTPESLPIIPMSPFVCRCMALLDVLNSIVARSHINDNITETEQQWSIEIDSTPIFTVEVIELELNALNIKGMLLQAANAWNAQLAINAEQRQIYVMAIPPYTHDYTRKNNTGQDLPSNSVCF